MVQDRIRNFCILSHVDHGKSTLADRFLELTGTIEKRKMREQVLDAMDLERERGITIKLTPVRMDYTLHTTRYTLNLLDTPGHVDFSYEVSRSLAAVEGAILLVDATQGIQAQTLANLELARAARLAIIPVVNKIDLPNADVEGTAAELSALTGVDRPHVLRISAKTGEGVPALLDALIERVPPPQGETTAPFRGLIFDSLFDAHKGVIVALRVVDGAVKSNAALAFAASGAEATALEVGVFRPEREPSDMLEIGEIGYVATGLKHVTRARVGDTLLHQTERGQAAPLPGYAVPRPNVFAGLYPERGEGYPLLRDALEKLRLSDAALTVELEHSPALGHGARCGFLGLLHLDIVRERLRREYGVEVVVTVPSVTYRVTLTDGSIRTVRSAAEFPDPSLVREVREPYVSVTVLARVQDLGGLWKLLSARQGTPPLTESLPGGRVAVSSELPLRTVIVDFHDDVKALTAGYGSFSLRPVGDRAVELVKVSVLVNHEPVEALSQLVPASAAAREGRRVVGRLKEVIPRHLFAIPLQAAVGGKIIARETIPALRKDVTAPLYGGDVTRKRKLLEQQKEGKRKLAARGTVNIPADAYLAVLKR